MIPAILNLTIDDKTLIFILTDQIIKLIRVSTTLTIFGRNINLDKLINLTALVSC